MLFESTANDYQTAPAAAGEPGYLPTTEALLRYFLNLHGRGGAEAEEAAPLPVESRPPRQPPMPSGLAASPAAGPVTSPATPAPTGPVTAGSIFGGPVTAGPLVFGESLSSRLARLGAARASGEVSSEQLDISSAALLGDLKQVTPVRSAARQCTRSTTLLTRSRGLCLLSCVHV